MIDGATLKRGLPDRQSLLGLLNESYGWWGDEPVLTWTYDQYPGFEGEHAFYITVDGELAAFRRVFGKEVVSGSGPNYRFFALGDTCVSPSHRGKGLYSKLHAETTDYCKRQGSDLSCTFNRVGHLTYEANIDRGWGYRTLPIRLRLFSPATVIPKYADKALGEDSVAATIFERADNLIVPKSGSDTGTAGSVVPSRLARLSDRVIATLVETAGSTDPARALYDRMSKEGGSASADWTDRAEIAIRSPPMSEETLSATEDAYTSLDTGHDLWFRRDGEDVRHLLSHPNLDVVVVVKLDGRILGVAPVTLDTGGAIDTLRILDLTARDDVTAGLLLEEIERIGRRRGADMAIAITDRDTGSRWARIDRQVMMWEGYDTDTGSLATDSLHVGLYDLV
jgi:GNAT superfamily N-acetyltransferase